MKILYVLNILHSRPDLYGNRYYSIEVIRTSDGATARGTISGGESNCTYALRLLAEAEETQYTSTVTELPIREYNRLVKNWPYMGCTPDQINPAILAQMN